MRRGGLQKERKDAKGEQQEFEYQAIPGCDTVYTVLKDRHAAFNTGVCHCLGLWKRVSEHGLCP